MSLSWIDITVLAVTAASLLLIYFSQGRRRLQYPPGPKGLPVVGNVFDMPETKPWIKYAQWSQEYGSPMIYLNALGQDIIIINDHNLAQEAFDKRSDIYSNRPHMPMLGEVLSQSVWNFAFQHAGTDKWKTCRREFNLRFRQVASRNFRPFETRMTVQLLDRLLTTPKEFMRHLHYMTGSFVLNFAYGIKVEPKNDKYMEIARHCAEGIERAGDKNLIDIFPWLQHVPSWLPGMGWKKQVDGWRHASIMMCNAPYEYVKEQMEKGTAKSCLATDLLSGLEERPGDPGWKEDIIKSICATAFVGATDTTISGLNSFVLMMMLFPDVQKKAQEQIDRVVGRSRLPEFSDQDDLPYITAIIREVLRCSPPLPFAVPHATTKADVLNDYYIPKGATVVGNSWAMLRDPTAYPEPEKFKPERFLTPDGNLDPTTRNPDDVFGFGKRICLGRFSALDTLWIATASMLATFDFTKPKGLDIELGPDLYISGLVSHPAPFECIITPRSKEKAELIRSSLAGSEDL